MTAQVLVAWHTMGAFLWRDAKTEVTYKLAFSGQVVGIFFQLGSLYFIAKTFQGAIVPYLRAYNGDYFAFVMIGLAFASYVSVALYGVTQQIREAQMQGTLEALLSTPTGMVTILFASSLWPLCWTTLQVGLYILTGVIVFHCPLHVGTPAGVAALMVLTVASHMAIWILSASVILVYKKGGPFDQLVMMGSHLLGGVYYPVEALPSWLQWVANLLPLTHALRGMRKVLLLGTPFSGITGELAQLGVVSIVLMPMALVIFRQALLKAKRDGTLTQY